MIILICGLPRAGKTTYSQRYVGKCKIYHADDYGCPVNAYVRISKKLNSDEDVVVEGLYNRAETRASLIAPHSKEKTICIWLDTPIEIKKTRQGYSRHCEYPFEPPTLDEGWDEIIIIRGEYEQRINRKE